jgi:hypothetical protein
LAMTKFFFLAHVVVLMTLREGMNFKRSWGNLFFLVSAVALMTFKEGMNFRRSWEKNRLCHVIVPALIITMGGGGLACYIGHKGLLLLYSVK